MKKKKLRSKCMWEGILYIYHLKCVCLNNFMYVRVSCDYSHLLPSHPFFVHHYQPSLQISSCRFSYLFALFCNPLSLPNHQFGVTHWCLVSSPMGYANQDDDCPLGELSSQSSAEGKMVPADSP